MLYLSSFYLSLVLFWIYVCAVLFIILFMFRSWYALELVNSVKALSLFDEFFMVTELPPDEWKLDCLFTIEFDVEVIMLVWESLFSLGFWKEPVKGES